MVVEYSTTGPPDQLLKTPRDVIIKELTSHGCEGSTSRCRSLFIRATYRLGVTVFVLLRTAARRSTSARGLIDMSVNWPICCHRFGAWAVLFLRVAVGLGRSSCRVFFCSSHWHLRQHCVGFFALTKCRQSNMSGPLLFHFSHTIPRPGHSASSSLP
jgi:hypothetical protein